jgi:hypothetical protein
MAPEPDPLKAPPSSAPAAQALFGVLAVVLVLAVVVAYRPALRAAYVFDDETLVVQDTRCNANILRCFSIPFFPTSPFLDPPRVYYRPLVTASFVLFQTAAEQHAANLLLHAINALLLFMLARRSGGSPLRAAALVLAWAIHPRLAEAVTWVSGRTDLLATTFLLGALLAWPAAPLPSRVHDVLRRVVAAALLAGGMLAKEIAVAGALGIAVASMVAAGPRRGALRAVPAACAVALAGAARVAALGVDASGGGPQTPMSTLARLTAPFEAVARYAHMTLWFHEPWSVRGALGIPSWSHVFVGLLLVPVLAWGAVVVVRAGDRVHVAVTGLVALLASAQIVRVALHGAVVADRLLYVPLAMLAVVLAGPLASRARESADGPFGRAPARRDAWIAAATFGLACAFAPFARRAAGVFESELLFLVTVAERADPENAGPRNALAVAVRDHGAVPLGCALFERSRSVLGDDERRDGPAFVRTSENLAACFVRAGRIPQSIAVYEDLSRALAGTTRGMQERAGRVALGLGYARLAALDFEPARAAADEALRLDARLAVPVGRLRRAIRGATEEIAAVRALPPEAHTRRAVFAESVGRAEEAAREWSLVANDPRAPASERKLAMQYLAYDGRLDEAASALDACPDCREEAASGVSELIARLRRRRYVLDTLRGRIEALAR